MGSEAATVATTNAIGRQRLDLYVAGSVFLLLVAYSPALYAPFWSIRFALTVLLAGIGLPRLLPMLRHQNPGATRPPALRPPALRWPALAAAVFLAIAVVATLLSGHIGASVLGLYNWGTGLLFVAGLVGGWAAAASAGPACQRLVERAFLGGALLNLAIGVIEGGYDLHALSLPEYQGRAHGLLGNPVHLGAIAAATVALLVAHFTGPVHSPWRSLDTGWPFAAIALAAAAIEVSGARSGLIVLGGVLVWTWLRHDRRSAAAATVAAVAGLAIGLAILHLGGHAATGTASRLAGESGGFKSRIGHWRAALPAIGHRPFFGAGPGRFGAATTSHVSLAAARAEHFNRFVDAHNLVVEYATTTGLLGVAALLTWLVLAVRRGRGPLLGAALAILAVGLVEPQSVSSTPVAFLLLGASAAPFPALPAVSPPAAPATPAAPSSRRAETVLSVLVAAVAVVFACRVVLGDWWLHETHLDLTIHEGRAALRVFPPWPVSANLLATAYVFQSQARADPSLEATARHWYEVAAARDPSDPGAWMTLADKELADGLPSAARQHYGKAHGLDPWSTRALNGLGQAELALGHRETARSWFLQSLRVVSNETASSELAQLG